ncbi:MAG: leucine--tRNA ligase [Lachnospiraceae bacterium]|nr:leucine--tRNA ligase [Lachnospiraceae bacterium]
MQTEWIGKSYGAEVDFEIADEVASKTVGASKAVGASKTVGASTASPNIVEANKTVVASESVGASTASPSKNKITVYTTRPDTLYGATFMVLAPEHDLAMKLATDDKRAEVENYIKTASMKTNVDRMQVSDKDKTGVWTGRYAINPLNGKKIPIWISDYVLNDYGTGAIMCVPAHDTRDFAFAKKFNLDIVPVIAPKDDIHKFDNGMDEAFVSTDGIVINSGEWDGRVSSELKKNAPDELEKKGIGKKTVNYKIRDWVFSRQRYWGEPIPIVHCPKCGNVAVPVEELPLKLPDVKSYEPSGTGESPLVNITDWVNCKCPKCGGDAKRETNTMPQWAGSSWYFLRYIDVHNDKALVDKEKADKYLPVDMYIGGVEHAVLHLLYSRFWTKFLYDIGAIGFDEPFHKLFNQGMILGPKGVKMSKSLGNVVNPDEMVDNYGCDTLRMYELFIGPPDMDAAWDDRGIEGVYKYLNRLYNLVEKNVNENREATKECLYIRHNLIKAVTDRLEKFSLNTVISGFMEYTNSLIELDRKEGYIDKETLKTIAVLLSPFAPHVAEEFYHMLGGNGTVFEAGWPKFDENLAKADTVKLPIQVNGKTRGFVEVDAGADEKEVINKAKETIKEKLTGDIVKEIYVKGKIINFVVK